MTHERKSLSGLLFVAQPEISTSVDEQRENTPVHIRNMSRGLEFTIMSSAFKTVFPSLSSLFLSPMQEYGSLMSYFKVHLKAKHSKATFLPSREHDTLTLRFLRPDFLFS